MQEAILSYIVSGGRVGRDTLVKHVANSLLDVDLTSPRRKETIKSVASRLVKKGLLKFESGHYSATYAGKRIFDEWEKSNYKIRIPKKWDKKWRVIIFDIPEKKKRVREQVRLILSTAGFIRLQDSVWVYPYDCEDIIGLLKADLGVGKNILYMIVDEIENDKHLREHFNLI